MLFGHEVPVKLSMFGLASTFGSQLGRELLSHAFQPLILERDIYARLGRDKRRVLLIILLAG